MADKRLDQVSLLSSLKATDTVITESGGNIGRTSLSDLMLFGGSNNNDTVFRVLPYYDSTNKTTNRTEYTTQLNEYIAWAQDKVPKNKNSVISIGIANLTSGAAGIVLLLWGNTELTSSGRTDYVSGLFLNHFGLFRIAQASGKEAKTGKITEASGISDPGSPESPGIE